MTVTNGFRIDPNHLKQGPDQFSQRDFPALAIRARVARLYASAFWQGTFCPTRQSLPNLSRQNP